MSHQTYIVKQVNIANLCTSLHLLKTSHAWSLPKKIINKYKIKYIQGLHDIKNELFKNIVSQL